jgi:uncharacterized membrane protein
MPSSLPSEGQITTRILSCGVIRRLAAVVQINIAETFARLERSNPVNFITTYLSVAGTFIVLDMVWLKTMAERLYRPVLGDLLRPEPNLIAATVFYILYPIGLLGFAVVPAHEEASALRAFTSGMMFGCFTYATYDLTNQATLRNWSTTLTVADVCWGSLLAGVSAWVGYFVTERMGYST